MKEQDRQAALAALEELANTRMELSMSDWSRICSTIRAALTAPDVNAEKYDALFGTIESQKQTHDALIRINRELLEALKDARKRMGRLADINLVSKNLCLSLNFSIARADKAIARAEAQKVGE